MCSSVDYKWRKRMCRKWQEELRQQQQQKQQQKQKQEQKEQLEQQEQQKKQQQQKQQKQQLQQQQRQLQQQQRQLFQHQQQLQLQQQQQTQREQRQLYKQHELQQQQQQQQQQQKQQEQVLFAPPLAKRSLSSFAADPMNLRKLFLTRRTLELLSPRLDFQRLVKSCFVRVKFGVGHRVAQIQAVGKCRPSNEITLILRIDNDPRVYGLEQLSNSYFEEPELMTWKYVWQAHNFDLPSRSIVEQKYKAITDSKLQAMAQAKTQLQHSSNSCSSSGSVAGPSFVQQNPLSRPQLYSMKPSCSNKLPLRPAAATPPNAPPAAVPCRKYLVEPLECYRAYLPTVAASQKRPIMEPPAQQLDSMCSKKKISLDEYRKRCTKK